MPTPSYVCDRASLARNLTILDRVQQRTGCRILLALKGFAAQDNRYIAMDLVNPAIDLVGLARSFGVPGMGFKRDLDQDLPGAGPRGPAVLQSAGAEGGTRTHTPEGTRF